jgi:hypothetical protein
VAVELGVAYGQIMPPTAPSGHAVTHREPGGAAFCNSELMDFQSRVLTPSVVAHIRTYVSNAYEPSALPSWKSEL